MPYPDKLLADDEEVVEHLHPHWTTLFWPVVRLLVVVGAGSYLAALVPDGRQQGVLRMALLAVVLGVLAVAVVRPVLRWWTTHVVLTTHRVLVREGVLSRRGRDVGLSRITDVSCRQTLPERFVRSGTIAVESVGDGGPLVLRRVPRSDAVQALLAQLVQDDAERWAYAGPGPFPGPFPGDRPGRTDEDTPRGGRATGWADRPRP
ncbi:PH (Pleckstrin Homology) domain-containing protein [Geodermatophilus normandii]|uniref:PH (Pleckstrin Homology) domain-containing protein n=1 Tax=Geodermatophilus normandii TaxID=1137989 RepID=A0A317QHV9_9ACTN|nr:PH domain-containing protein [Geodermatophilus normandii]PWW22912.1 PH (Pleckstrin Homology) domain-containing protein [Geodermatophilus normandii]